MDSSISSTTWHNEDTITLTISSLDMKYPIILWVINYSSSDLQSSAEDLVNDGKVFDDYKVATTTFSKTIDSDDANINTLTPICIDAGAPNYVDQTMSMPFSALQQYNHSYEIGTTYNITHILGDIILTGIITWLKNWFNTKEEHDAMLFTNSGWQTCTLSSGYTVHTSSTTLRVRKVGKFVELSGVAKSSAEKTNGEYQFATIPSGYRPAATQEKVCQGSGMNRWLLTVKSTGAMTIARYGTTAYATQPSGVWLPYTITYMVD